MRPLVRRLVLLCLRFALRSRQPQQYYLVLRVLFRVMTGGKLDGLMRELHPLLPQILIGACVRGRACVGVRGHACVGIMRARACVCVVRMTVCLPHD